MPKQQTVNLPAKATRPGRGPRFILRSIGLLLATVGGMLLTRELHSAQDARGAAGVIIDVRHRETTAGRPHAPVIQFTAADGSVVHFEGPPAKRPPVVGTAVKVLYDPANPGKARLDNPAERWLFPAVVTPAGLLLVAASFRRRK